MSRSWKSRVGMLAVVALVLGLLVVGTAGPSGASGGGNSANADFCRDLGWQITLRSDGTRFDNVGACVSWVARGGDLMSAPSSQICEAYGGTFVAGTGDVLWDCNGLLPVDADTEQARGFNMGAACGLDGGHRLMWSNYPVVPMTWTCSVS